MKILGGKRRFGRNKPPRSNQPRVSDSTSVALVYIYISQKSITYLLSRLHVKQKSLKYPTDTIWCKSFPPGFKDKKTSWELIKTKSIKRRILSKNESRIVISA